jgi:hypothetical protein
LALSITTMAGCSGHAKVSTDIIQAGQVDIQLPPGWRVTHNGAVAPADDSGGFDAAAGGPGTTIPLAKQDPTTAFFQASGAFTSCLKGLGVTFVGAPDPSDPSSPANNPDYLKSLETCAAQSHIVQALKAMQTSQDDMTPKQIQQENQQYLKWRTCMIGRGWQIPQPTPDSKGRLFSFSGGGGGAQMTPPPGEDALSSPDIQACASQSEAGGSSAS